jgi:4-hydroxybenzoate polyprenyltransferase
MVRARLDAYERLVRLDKPIGTALLLWPTLSALWLATEGAPSWLLVVVFVTGTVLMRSAGCAVNDWADRRYDARVERTASRPMATGEVAPREALLLAAVLAFCAFLLVLDQLQIWQRARHAPADEMARPPDSAAFYAIAAAAGVVYAFASSKLFYAALGQFNIASRIDKNTVCRRGNIQGSLRNTFAIGINEFTRLFKFQYGFSYLL